MTTCAAHRTNGEPCKAPAMRGKRVCRVHGGMTPSGIASPHYKTGERSRSLPTRMAAAALAARNDPKLMELREDLVLLEARIEDLLTRVDTGESGRIWSELQSAAAELRASAGDHKKQGEWLNVILDLISQGHADYRAWAEVGAVLEQRRKVVESESKRLIASQQMISAEQAMLLVGGILGVIKANVQDRQALNAVQRGIELLMTKEAE